LFGVGEIARLVTKTFSEVTQEVDGPIIDDDPDSPSLKALDQTVPKMRIHPDGEKVQGMVDAR
jgi:hypothetical protein